MEEHKIIIIEEKDTLSGKLKITMQSLVRDGIRLQHFSNCDLLFKELPTWTTEEREAIAVVIFTYRSRPEVNEKLIKLFRKYIPFSTKIACLRKEDAFDILQVSNEIFIEKFIFYPIDSDAIKHYVETIFEKFLEHNILRRSLQEIRETYETMKEQLKTIKEANTKLDKKIMELSTLSEISSNFMSSYEEEKILRETVLTLMGQKGASFVILFLHNEEKNIFEPRYHRGVPDEFEIIKNTYPLQSSLIDSFFIDLKAVFLEDIPISQKCRTELEQLGEFDTQIVIPLLSKNQRKGFILLGTRITGMKYRDEDFEFFTVLSNQLVFALENAHLYEKLQLKISELEDANKELRKLDKMKSEFITIASHELRTPLTAVKGYAELLLSGKFGVVAPKQSKAIEIMNKNVDRLIRISDDVVQLSKIDADRISVNLIPTAIEKFILELVEEIRPFLQSRHQKIHLSIPKDCPVVLVDPNLFNQVISELVKNAIRFTDDNGNIWIEVNQVSIREIAPRLRPFHYFENYVKISVKDDGIGIPEDEYDRIFERFYEIQHSNYHHSGGFTYLSGGTGLGLSIAKGIIEKHGGAIWVTSGLSQGKAGSTFSFILPVPSFS